MSAKDERRSQRNWAKLKIKISIGQTTEQSLGNKSREENLCI